MTTPQQTAAQPPRLFYGWVIVACVWLANFSTVSLNPLVFSFFLAPMTEDLGMSRSTLVWGITIRMVAGGFSAPYIGRLVDRYGARWIGAGSGVVVGLVLFGFAVTSNAWVFYLLFLLSGLSGFGLFGASILTVVPPSNWFVAKRGRAVSIASSGQLLGSAVFAILAALLIDAWGWRVTWAIFGAVALVGVVPAYAIFMRRSPEDMGLHPDGALTPRAPAMSAATATAPARPIEEVHFTVGEALRTPVLWANLVALTMMSLCISPFLLYRNQYWATLGFSPAVIAIGVALDPAMVAVSSIAMGFVAERIPIRYTGVIGGVWRGFGMLPLTLGATWPASVVLHNVVWGIGSGTTQVFQNLIFPDYFGRAHQGAIRGAITPIMIIVGSLGGPLGGYLLDAGLPWSVFFWGIFIGVMIPSAAFYFMKPPRPPVRTHAEPATAAMR